MNALAGVRVVDFSWGRGAGDTLAWRVRMPPPDLNQVRAIRHPYIR